MEKVYGVGLVGFDNDYEPVEVRSPCVFRTVGAASAWAKKHENLANTMCDFYRERCEEMSILTDDWDGDKHLIYDTKYWYWRVRTARYYITELELR